MISSASSLIDISGCSEEKKPLGADEFSWPICPVESLTKISADGGHPGLGKLVLGPAFMHVTPMRSYIEKSELHSWRLPLCAEEKLRSQS